MKKSEYIPYNFDIKYELKIYETVGIKHKLLHLYKNKRKYKKLENRKVTSYMNMDTYSQWESYMNEKFAEYSGENLKNFRHYLKRKKKTSFFWDCYMDIYNDVNVCHSNFS